MPSLEFYTCRECATVYAAPEAPPVCDRCGGREFADLTGRLGAAPYFSRGLERGGEPE